MRGKNKRNEKDILFTKNVQHKTIKKISKICNDFTDKVFCTYNNAKQVTNIKNLSRGKLNNLFKVLTKRRNEKTKDIFNFTWYFSIMLILKTPVISHLILKTFSKILDSMSPYKYDDIKT